MPSHAEELYEQIVSSPDPVAYLTAQANGVSEEEWLDFKGQPTDSRNRAENGKDALKIWSEAVTGFSNTEGGVLIWGIDARFDPATKRDVSVRLNLIQDPAQLESHLKNGIAALTTPPTQGIKIRHFPETGPGFVVCLIPEGKVKPYRAENGDKYYFIRSGTSFRDANPALLRTMFFPKVSPDIRIFGRSFWKPFQIDTQNAFFQNEPPAQVPFEFALINQGQVSAENIHLKCETLGMVKGEWSRIDNRWGNIAPNVFWLDHYINPSEIVKPAHFLAYLPVHYEGPYKWPNVGISFRFVVSGKDMIPRKLELPFSQSEIADGKEKEAVIFE